MLRIPYTLDQAQSLCNKLQHLVGCCFDVDSQAYSTIECVAIAPFDIANKKVFLMNYLLCNDAKKALKENYKGLLYDIIVIARSIDDTLEIVQEDVTTWMKKNNFAFTDNTSFILATETQAYL